MTRRQRPTAAEGDAILQSLAAPEVIAYDVPGYLRCALQGLPPRQRDVVVLRLLEELSVRETATVLGCREGTVKAHLAKAMANLRSRLGNIDIAVELDE